LDLAEALEELRVGVLRDASTLKSGPPDEYWSDTRLVRYIDDAHRRFARQTFCIRDDTTPEVTQLTLNTNIAVYTLHRSVMKVETARHQDDQQDMVRITHDAAVNTQNVNTEDFQFALVTAPGKPTRFSTDEGIDPSKGHGVRLRLLGVPDSTQNGKVVYLRVIRQPLKRLSLDDEECHFEVPEEYHLDVLEWAAYRALRNWDIDSEDRTKAEAHKRLFEQAVKECKKDVLRKIWQPLRWNFGGNGFSYIKN
jgi:hypothetical protein